jgi:hypothetical protein
MIFKIIAFLAAAIPIFLFVRSIFFTRTTRINEGLREFKKQANLAVSIFLFLIVCVVVFAAGKLAWTWWSSLWTRGVIAENLGGSGLTIRRSCSATPAALRPGQQKGGQYINDMPY